MWHRSMKLGLLESLITNVSSFLRKQDIKIQFGQSFSSNQNRNCNCFFERQSGKGGRMGLPARPK